MPATFTHHAFTNDVYKILEAPVKNRLEGSLDLFNLFGKSFDIFFFIKPKIGYYAHGNNSSLYFKNIIKYMNNNDLINNSIFLAYLYGSICHYVLDSTIHPFVYYKSGQYKWNQETLKYRGKHSYVEKMMDAAFYEFRDGKPIYKARLKRELAPKIKFDSQLLLALNDIFKETYDLTQDAGKIYKKGYKIYSFALRHLMTSRWGIKTIFYKLIDYFKLYKKTDVMNYCYYVKKIDYSVLNLEHKKWCYPCDKNLQYHYSFYDLYDIAILKAKSYIDDLDQALRENKGLDKVLLDIGNLSYYTGLDTDKKYKMKYFEY